MRAGPLPCPPFRAFWRCSVDSFPRSNSSTFYCITMPPQLPLSKVRCADKHRLSLCYPISFFTSVKHIFPTTWHNVHGSEVVHGHELPLAMVTDFAYYTAMQKVCRTFLLERRS